MTRDTKAEDRPLRSRTVGIKVFCVVLAAAVVLQAVPGECRRTRADSGKTHRSDSLSTRGLRGDYPRDATRLFFKVLRMIRNLYDGDFSEAREFDRALKEFSLVVPPQCVEDLTPMAGCDREPEQCFLDAIYSLSSCGMGDMKKVLVRVLKIMLRNMDSNSALMDPRMFKELKISTSGKFGGVGMVVGEKSGDYVVISALEGSPAFKAGIKAGDTILAIDGEPIHGLPLLEVLGKVRGRPGSRIGLTIRSGATGNVRRIVLRRRVISIPPVRSAMLGYGIGYIKIINFQTGTARAVKRALRRMLRDTTSGLEGLVLDLRSNPGGLFDEAVKVADLLLPSGPITVVKGKLKDLNREFRARSAGTLPSRPIVVLINKGTASAAEILTAALRQRRDVIVMGEHSFGKASVQGVFLVGEGRALRLTTAHYYTPDGRDIDGKGIKPDIELEDSVVSYGVEENPVLANRDPGTDPAVRRAMRYIATRRLSGKSPFPTLF